MRNNEVFIALGTNLGDRSENLRKAIREIELNVGVMIKQSSLYETKAWGKTNQPDFYNQVILINSNKTPEQCLYILSGIEQKMGRKRDEKWGARIIDLDLLYINAFIIETNKFTLPHPAIAQRRFVLIPLVEIAPDFIHPLLKKNQRQLLTECPDILEVKLLNT